LNALVFQFAVFPNMVFNLIGFSFFIIAVKLRVIGLTGGIACGKSSVSYLLKGEGFHIIDCDQISHDLRIKDKTYIKELVASFGETIWDAEKKEIKSDVLGDIVFKDAKQRKKLNSITHWRIFRDLFK